MTPKQTGASCAASFASFSPSPLGRQDLPSLPSFKQTKRASSAWPSRSPSLASISRTGLKAGRPKPEVGGLKEAELGATWTWHGYPADLSIGGATPEPPRVHPFIHPARQVCPSGAPCSAAVLSAITKTALWAAKIATDGAFHGLAAQVPPTMRRPAAW